MESVQNKMEQLSLEFTQKQTEMSDLMQARQKLEAQYQENKIVMDEFEKMKDFTGKDEVKIYKQTGSVLLPVGLTDSITNVQNRIDFIAGEIKRVEEKISKVNKDMETKRDALMKMQQ